MKHRPSTVHRRTSGGFTLVEVLVSTVLIVAIMVLLLSTIDQTQRIWSRSRSKTTQFQTARSAFDAMTRRLAQATLNTYWKPHEITLATEKSDFKFRRQGELQFISGPTKRFINAPTVIPNVSLPVDENYPSHAMFFSAPIGYTEYPETGSSGLRKFRSLDSMLAACGYFIEFGDDPSTPEFLKKLTTPYPSRLRYRLMEMTVPAERFNIYARPTDSLRLIDPRIFDENTNYYNGLVDTSRKPNAGWIRALWMKEAFQRASTATGTNTIYKFSYARPLADNIVALIILPKLAVKDRVTPGTTTADPNVLELAPKYEFDSWRTLTGGDDKDPLTGVSVDNRARDNLLPPIVQVTMVAIDEPSAARMALKLSGKPDWLNKPDKLFQDGSTVAKFQEDLGKLEVRIRDDATYKNLGYRIFTTDVVIRGSKWSRDP